MTVATLVGPLGWIFLVLFVIALIANFVGNGPDQYR